MAKNNTTFDNVFRTMLEKMPELIVPVLNEIFGTNYPLDVPLEQLRNEHQTLNGEKITDSYFRNCGMEVLGFTLLSNMAAGILDQPLSEL